MGVSAAVRSANMRCDSDGGAAVTEHEKKPKPVEVRVDYMLTPMLIMASRVGSKTM
jgi:hypothetical protein